MANTKSAARRRTPARGTGAMIMTRRTIPYVVAVYDMLVVEQQTQERQYSYQVNLTQALSKMKDTVVLFFNRSSILGLISDLLDLFIKTIEPIRPDRKFSRKKGIKKQGFYPCYKSVR
ncbi:MAG: hypothetical protein PHT49_06505 [Desulfovibrionales bacterium]|nr:hypothetical protein [Desulfovibrionales bacterium]